MRAAILSAALAGLVSSGGTYAVVHYRQPDMQSEIQQARTDGDLSARLELAKREDNAALLSKILEVDSAILSGQQAVYQAQAATYKSQLEYFNRAMLVSRIIARSITGTDPLPILQAARAPDTGLPDTPDIAATKKMQADGQAFGDTARRVR
jgi:hypothetical protein